MAHSSSRSLWTPKAWISQILKTFLFMEGDGIIHFMSDVGGLQMLPEFIPFLRNGNNILIINMKTGLVHGCRLFDAVHIEMGIIPVRVGLT